MRLYLTACLLFALTTSVTALADPAPPAATTPPPAAATTSPPQPAWNSSIEVGAVVSTGNTDQRSFKLRADTEHDGPRMRHTFHIDDFRQTQDGVVSADKFYGSYQADYKLQDPNALFGRYSYENDKFSGFAYQEDLTFGYSRRLINRANMTLQGDIGAGGRHSKLEGDGSTDEAIVRLALRYKWQVSESAIFKQNLSAESGENSIYRSETSLQSTIVGNLAMKLSYMVKHQTNVPIGRKQTDTETSLTAVYNF